MKSKEQLLSTIKDVMNARVAHFTRMQDHLRTLLPESSFIEAWDDFCHDIVTSDTIILGTVEEMTAGKHPSNSLVQTK